MNARGVILKAFERYRLKSCIDFKPWSGEPNYISVFKGNGCWSSVGKQLTRMQQLSIGEGCDKIATVQHEFLHALGFWHEQSRSDRDDYVSIIWDRIISGKERNFDSYNDQVIDSMNVPYDYSSVMHYSKTAFGNGSEPTIITRVPDFMDVIGQRMDFSDSDVLKLNQLYNCSSSLSFMESCDFELGNVCGMIQSSADSADWQRLSQVSEGPESDHSNMGQCRDIPSGSWQLYHVTLNVTSKFRVVFEGVRGAGASLGGLSIDDINLSETWCPHHVWHIRNFTQLIGSPNGSFFSPPFYSSKGYAFQIYLDLYSLPKIGMYFHLISGANDDQLEWPCPWQQVTMTILDQTPDIRQRMSNQRSLTTDPFLTIGSGFFMHFNSSSVNKGATAILESRILYPKRGFQCLQFFLYNSGSQDDQLNIYVREYSAAHVSSTLTLVEQIKDNGTYFWDRPSKVGAQVIFPNGTQFQRGRGRGFPNFMTQEMLKSRDFIKGDDVYILLTVEDISHLNAQNYPLPTLDVSDLCTSFRCENDGICILQNGRAECRCRSGDDWWYMGERCEKRGSTRDTIVIAISSTAAVFALMLIITLVSVYCTRKKYRKESSSRTVNTIME
ncbi:MEP1B, partial [Cervus elaphus hippelaphus]